MYALYNGVIFTGFEILKNNALIIEKDRIHSIIPIADLDPSLPKIDLQGANLCAGFIDLQINGCGGVMFNEDISLTTIETMHQTNLRSGTTSFLPTLITTSDEHMHTAVSVMQEYLKTHSYKALGLHLEGPYLSKAKKGVHPEKYIRELDQSMKDFLCSHGEVIKLLTLAPENIASNFIAEFVQAGITVAIGHSNATFEQAQQAINAGASCATHLHNAMSPISSGRDLGVVGAVLANSIFASVIVDGLHVHYANLKIDKQVKGNKLFIVTDALATSGCHIQSFKFSGKDIYVRDGKCVDSNGTLAGANITMIQSLQNAVEHLNIPLEEAICMCNLYPAQTIKMDNQLGSIAPNKIANLTAFNHSFKVIGTAVNGNWQWHS